jgi:hypothetical protein
MLGFEPTTFLIQRPFSNFFFRLDTHKNWNFFLVVRDGRFIKFQNFFLKISKRIKEIPSLGKSSLQFFHVSASITKKNTFSFRISFPSLLYHTQMSRELKKRTNNFKIFLWQFCLNYDDDFPFLLLLLVFLISLWLVTGASISPA